MRSSTFWHNRLKLSGELAKLEDPGARVPFTFVSGKDVAQLLLGVGEDKSHSSQRMILAHLLRHAPLPALLVLGINIVAGWTSFRLLLLLNDNTLSANGLAARVQQRAAVDTFDGDYSGAVGCCASCMSMVLNLLIALTSDCADIELQLLRG
ncbi:hypothetical protein PTSG_02721 [Salpingoeca rosetta]|uniref:Uncharacterized protein n=1 Tax=Salpingoeca rosetta (strain ATCC 50818 / BSB-021) TaxID=946362 RepID=F2U340_SALR5|nr:uncharacterized protein PTSG_02721 [Salpingoeca rosetta]EGD82034.1 hypothetical protein PTSG_02721 [Salpingoeca rosetta]|eukprot:XP_004996217.1 hypothetical protein PTSG_02721 [Salpingoeca rosetta]